MNEDYYRYDLAPWQGIKEDLDLARYHIEQSNEETRWNSIVTAYAQDLVSWIDRLTCDIEPDMQTTWDVYVQECAEDFGGLPWYDYDKMLSRHGYTKETEPENFWEIEEKAIHEAKEFLL